MPAAAYHIAELNVPSREKTTILSFSDKVVVALIFVNWLLYENLLFINGEDYFGTMFLMAVFACKLVFPFLLLIYAGFPPKKVAAHSSVFFYIIAFACLLIYSIIPSFFYGSIASWLKLIPVFFFFLGVLSFFYKRPAAVTVICRLLVGYVLLALLQYILIYITQTFESAKEGRLTGPFGLFGNTAATLYLPGMPFPLVRLSGFWKEPSNAAGASFCAFFLAKYISANSIGHRKFWKFSSYLCLISGFLAISNVGYLSIGCAGLFGFFFTPWAQNRQRKIIQLLILSPFAIMLVWVSLFSRAYLAKHPTDNVWLLAFTGVRGFVDEKSDFDPYDGRIELLQYAVSETGENILGRGLQKTGATGIKAPAGAPLFWLFLAGYPGFLFIMTREVALLLLMVGSLWKNKISVYLCQAFIAVLVQESINGSWMDPNYLIMASFVIVSMFHSSRRQTSPEGITVTG